MVSGLRYRDLFRDHEFSGMYAADVLTLLGTYLGRFAVAVLVFERTGSVALTAGVFAASYLPHLFGPWLATLADIFPTKGLLVLADISRAAIALVLVIPDVPYWLILVVLFTIETIQIPFGAARLATLSDVLTKEEFPVGNALVAASRQAIQVISFAVGGVIVYTVDPEPALYVNAASYLVSAVLIQSFVRARPVAWHKHDTRPSIWSGTKEGLAFIRDTPHMTAWFALLGVGPGMIVVAEALAVPWAEHLGWDERVAALMMSSIALGGVVGLMIFGRLRAEQQFGLVYPLAFSTSAIVALAGLTGWLTHSPVPVIAVLFLSGASVCYLVAIQAKVSAVIPREARGRIFGLGNTVMQLSQGSAILVAGAIGENVRIGWVLIGLGCLGAAVISLIYARDRSHARVHADARA